MREKKYEGVQEHIYSDHLKKEKKTSKWKKIFLGFYFLQYITKREEFYWGCPRCLT
jgi:hypothetical protein